MEIIREIVGIICSVCPESFSSRCLEYTQLICLMLNIAFINLYPFINNQKHLNAFTPFVQNPFRQDVLNTLNSFV
uniref:Uncharacterized protein n=1 Tax=Globodera rostochiensis TaxID=31243 RepID=A0A914HHN3_GLORO